MQIGKGVGGMVAEKTVTWPQLRSKSLEGPGAAEGTRYQATALQC